ncbi:MAG: dihydrodipicolinate synthase family protein [Opitutaceae bacterium]|nr:dihydrodipicolinate synthase family protein [Opitutaceae bacterium]
MTTPDSRSAELRQRLTGPIPSLKTPFLRDGAVDYAGLRRLIDFNLAAGARALMLTAGDSHYVALTEREIAEVTRVTVEHTAGRALVIAADRYYHTTQAVDFARFARDTGADVLMVMPPDWGGSCTPRSLVEHYRQVGEVMPVMLVTNVFIARGQKFGLETIALVRDAVPNVVAVKDDMIGEFARKMALLVHGRWAVISGGQKQNHLLTHPYGCDGYLSTLISLRPAIAWAYWDAITRGDLAAARDIIRDYDFPFFELVMGLPGGFNAGIQALHELTGVAGRWRRPPYHSLTDEQFAGLRDGLQRLRLLP